MWHPGQAPQPAGDKHMMVIHIPWVPQRDSGKFARQNLAKTCDYYGFHKQNLAKAGAILRQCASFN
jgi:hypothetical protein